MLQFKQTILKLDTGYMVSMIPPTSFDKYDKEEKLEIIQKLIDNYNVLKKEIKNEH